MWIPGQQDDLVGRGTCTQSYYLSSVSISHKLVEEN